MFFWFFLVKRVAVVPQDKTLKASLLLHHVVRSLSRREDVGRQRRAQATSGAQVQLTHLKRFTYTTWVKVTIRQQNLFEVSLSTGLIYQNPR